MQRVLLFGATGHLGKEIAKELKGRGYLLTAVVRNAAKAAELSQIADSCRIADVTHTETLRDICHGYEVVISALGKSVSLHDKTKPGFWDIDYIANNNILTDAKKNGVSKFIYISAFGAEKFGQLEYFKSHHEFSKQLLTSGINYSIIKPPAMFSAFLDIMDMARKGRLVNLGAGDKRTNPIFEGDLAEIVVSAISDRNSIIEAGGKTVYLRRQLNEIIHNHAHAKGKLRTIPLWPARLFLRLLKIIDKNTYDKIAFFLEVIRHDLVAPSRGEMSFENYLIWKTPQGEKDKAPSDY